MTSINRRLSRRGFLKTGMAVSAAGSLAYLDTAHTAREPASEAGEERALFDALEDAPTPLIMDALVRLGHERTRLAMARSVRPMIPSAGTIAGPAVTTKYEESDTPTTRDDIRSYVFRPVDEAAPGSIWVTESGTSQILSMFGDVIVLACREKGLAGLVTDGGCRDLEGMEEIGLPVYAAGTCLYGPGSVIRPVAANEPIVCGGIEIAPGDVVAADVNGVMAFPRAALSAVVQKMGELEAKEIRSRSAIEEGQPLETAYEF